VFEAQCLLLADPEFVADFLQVLDAVADDHAVVHRDDGVVQQGGLLLQVLVVVVAAVVQHVGLHLDHQGVHNDRESAERGVHRGRLQTQILGRLHKTADDHLQNEHLKRIIHHQQDHVHYQTRIGKELTHSEFTLDLLFLGLRMRMGVVGS